MDRIGVAAGDSLIQTSEESSLRTGKSSMAEYRGSYAECQTRKTQLLTLGAFNVIIRSEGNGWYVCQGEFPFGFDGTAVDLGTVPSIHELDVNVLQTSVYRSSKVRKYLGSGKFVACVQRAVLDYQNGKGATSTDSGWTTVGAELVNRIHTEYAAGERVYIGGVARTEQQNKDDAVALYGGITCMGVEDFIEYTSIYTRTLTAATPEQVRASFEGYGKIWTTDEINDFEGLDPNGFFILNPGSQWLKSRPKAVIAGGQKTQVIYTYTECLTAFGMTYDAYNAAVLLNPPA